MHICRKEVWERGDDFIRVSHFSTFEAKPQVGENLINGHMHEEIVCDAFMGVRSTSFFASFFNYLLLPLSLFLHQGWLCTDFS